MKSLKDNFLVKTAFSYVNLFYLFFPFMLFWLLLPILFNLPFGNQNGHTVLLNVDLFNLFGKEKFITDINIGNVILWIIIFIANASIVLGIFLGLRRLNKFMKNVLEEKPFVRENGEYLKTIGIIIMILSTIIFLSHMSSGFLIPFPVHGVVKYLYFVAILISSLFNPYLVVGLVVFVIGEIIVRASELKEEQDLTV
jgi:Protein of unknown function (DUF2975)